MSKPDDAQEISRTKKNIILFMLSSVAFGIVLSFMAWSVPYFIPAGFPPVYALIASIFALLALGIVAFRLMVPRVRITDAINCYLVYDMRKGEVLSPINMNSHFWHVAAYGFQELSKAKPEYKDVLKQPLDLNNDILKQFMMYSILCWLNKLPAVSMFSALRTTVPRPPRIYREPNEKMKNIHHAYYTTTVSNAFVNVPSLKTSTLPHIVLPRSIQLGVTNDKIVMRNRYVKIEIGYHIYQWWRGVDLRLQNILGLTEEENESLGSLSAIITLDAVLNPLSAIERKAVAYWNFANDMLENLRAEYDWSVLLEDMKELLTWENLTKHKLGKLL